MPFITGVILAGVLRGWGLIGLLTLTLGAALIQTIVGANISPAAGQWSVNIFYAGLFVWAMRRPSESEAKLDLLRAIRFLIAGGMVVAAIVGLFFLGSDGFLLFGPNSGRTWLYFGITAISGLVLYGFRKWIALDEARSSAGR